jgi:nucleoside-diphosphate-sugar epimerase
MSKRKIAIFGASGFVGSALVERLFFDKGYEFKPLIHSLEMPHELLACQSNYILLTY